MSSSSFRRLTAAVLMTATLTGPVLSQSQRSFQSFQNDVLPSFPAPLELAKAAKAPAGKAFGSSDRVLYPSAGTVYQLTRFHGLYVEILLPDDWLQVLSTAQVLHFLDRTDLIYQYLLEMVGAPPAGDGPVQIVVVPNSCSEAVGCAPIGSKGVKMTDDPFINAISWRELAADIPSGVLVHELTHNFDIFSRFFSYEIDAPHAWTTFITNYYSAYAHEGYLGTSPEEVAQEATDITADIFNNPETDWESCVLEYDCPGQFVGPEFLIGGFGLQVALRYGPGTVTGFTSFMRQYAPSHLPGTTPEEKNDLYVEALAFGAQRDLGCVADTWHWHVSDAMRQKMQQLYGPNPDCEDHDHDGFTVLQGDCNDHSAAIHPGAVDRPDRLDDNCDGLVDERLYREPANRDFTAPFPLTLPAEVTASLGVADRDVYRFHLKSPGDVQIGYCAPNEGAVLFHLLDSAGEVQGNLLAQGGCGHRAFPLAAGDWHVEVTAEDPSQTLAYSISARNAAPWPPAPWARTAPPHRSGDGFVLTAATALPHLPVVPTEVRFWVSGQGFVGTVPYSRAAAFTWTPPAGVDPVASGLTYRAQVMAGGTPSYTITPPQAFATP
jgi:hypothetical protein